MEAAKAMIAENKVELSVAEVPNALYSEATVFNGEDSVRVCIADEHINIIRIEKNGETIFESNHGTKANDIDGYSLAGVKALDIYKFAMQVPLARIAFIKGDSNE